MNCDLFCTNVKADIDVPVSAASLQATRLAAIDAGTYFLASGKVVYQIKCSNPSKRCRRIVEEHLPRAENSDYLIPSPLLDGRAHVCERHSIHRAEIMSVVAQDDRLASIDSDGLCVFSNCVRDDRSSSYMLVPPRLGNGEPGWAGIALHQTSSTTCVTARQFYRDLNLYDKDTRVRTVHTMGDPLAITFVGAASVLGVTEDAALALYDLRIPENASCISRKTPASSSQLAIDSSQDGSFVGLAGRDRTLHVFDMRTLTFRDRWPSCLKYECSGLQISRQSNSLAYVCGVDNEVSLGGWSRTCPAILPGPQSKMISGANARSSCRVLGFRGDSRIAGMVLTLDKDDHEQLAVFSESGSFYLAAATLP